MIGVHSQGKNRGLVPTEQCVWCAAPHRKKNDSIFVCIYLPGCEETQERGWYRLRSGRRDRSLNRHLILPWGDYLGVTIFIIFFPRQGPGPRLAWNLSYSWRQPFCFWSSCIHLLTPGITGLFHHALSMRGWELNTRLLGCQANGLPSWALFLPTSSCSF